MNGFSDEMSAFLAWERKTNTDLKDHALWRKTDSASDFTREAEYQRYSAFMAGVKYGTQKEN